MQNRDISTTFLKGLTVLRAYNDGALDLTLAEIARRTGYDRATVRRMCLTLLEAGFMSQAPQGFRLSPRVLTFAGSFLQANEVGYSIQPILNEFAEELNGEITLAVRDGDRVLQVAQSATRTARVSIGHTTGSGLPMLGTASGQMILAGLDPEARRVLIEQLPLKRFTDQTCMDRAEILRRLGRVADLGAAVVAGEFEAGICGLAVPVGAPGQMRAVVTTTLPMRRYNDGDGVPFALSVLREAAARLNGVKALAHWGA